MFSGIIQCTGEVISVRPAGTTKTITVVSSISSSLQIDQSISHNGVCLTVVDIQHGSHVVDIVQETLSKTTFHSIAPGQVLNLERSITLSTLLDGHLVQGHVDTTLQCLDRTDTGGSWKFKFNLPMEHAGLVIPQGSISLDGVSLTIARLYEEAFEVAIIPYTFRHTNFQSLKPGDAVNAEFDLIGKYLLRQSSRLGA